MTVSTSLASKTYDGDNNTVNFPTTFAFFTSADIEVIERVVATGAETTKALTTDYTVTGGGGATGTVIAVTPPPDTVTWTTRRVVAETQGTALPVSGALPSKAVEQMVDRSVMMVQQHSEELGRALVFPKTDGTALDPTIPSSVDRASKLLAFDASGNPIVRNLVDGGTGTMSDLTDDPTPQLDGVLDTNSKAINESEGAAVASATSSDIWATDGNTVHITGTTQIDDFANAPRVGAVRRLIFDGALTLTHGSGITLPGSANITTAAGDIALVYADAADAFRVEYHKADGTAVAVVADGDIAVRMFTTPGASTYTPTSGMRFALVTCTGGGGGGGSSGTTANRGGAGGGAGSTAITRLTATQIGMSQTVTIGVGGAGGTGAGGPGAASSLGTLVVAGPGAGGAVGSALAAGGGGGNATTGDLLISGGDGSAPNGSVARGSDGGASYWGGGAYGPILDNPGTAARAFGAGGGGGSTTDTTASDGGAGKSGVVYIVEHL